MTVYLPGDPAKRRAALDCVGVTLAEATRSDLVEAFKACAGMDGRQETVVGIGRRQEPVQPVGYSPRPDIVLHGNASLRRYVEREFLA